ncbi:uncharacterized protein CEXT_564841 [Caerostris extrusa]|uniref:Uncharacterized protein n=1 Tax=Caerostris extrusa TaxID=172846 RepID=A0AAV4VVZ1_CAEEX|nr:uncharacterized protein CEXT_564841 [Caerostris extrusa]
MSSVRNIDLNADSDGKQGRIVHPVFAKCTTKDDTVPPEYRNKTFAQTNRIMSSTLPHSSSAGNIVGSSGQKTFMNKDKCGFYKRYSSKTLDNTKEISEQLEGNSDIIVSTAPINELNGQTASATTKGEFFIITHNKRNLISLS